MIKKILTVGLVLALAITLLAGCGESDGGEKQAQKQAEELSGKYSGDGGSLSFYPEGEVLVSFSDDFVWVLNGKENNKTYGYAFVKENEVTSYDKAEYLYLTDGKNSFAFINCIAEKDKITLYPGKSHETVLERVTD